jgi:microcystin-dependent protein
VQVTPDECVRYTGPDSIALEIQTGDTLATVDQKLIDTVTSMLDGSGIKIELNPGFICDLLQTYLPSVPDSKYPLPDLITAIIRTVCFMQVYEIGGLYFQLSLLQGEYDIQCLEDVAFDDGTVKVLQATITKTCQTADNLAVLTEDVNNNYVKLADLNMLIQAYLDSQSGNITQQYKKMVPYTAVEYYGPLTNFDATGAGLTNLGWNKIYLCNGSNGTPDKRGRVGVGAINGVPGGPLNPSVDPTYVGNPNYDLGDTGGINSVALGLNNIPNHTHTATVLVSEAPHTHALASVGTYGAGGPTLGPGGTLQVVMSEEGNGSYRLSNSTTSPANLGVTSPTKTNLTVGVTNSSVGNGVAHTNIQPVVAAYYIMYIP